MAAAPPARHGAHRQAGGAEGGEGGAAGSGLGAAASARLELDPLAAQLELQYPPQPPLETEKRNFGYAQLTPPPAATSGSGSEVGRLFRASAETRTALETSAEGLACLAVLDVPACRRDALPLLRMHQTDASRA